MLLALGWIILYYEGLYCTVESSESLLVIALSTYYVQTTTYFQAPREGTTHVENHWQMVSKNPFSGKIL
jgi:hypothetical protein